MERFLRYLIFYGLIAATACSGTLLLVSGSEVTADVSDVVAPQKEIDDTIEGWQHKYTIAPQGQGIYWVLRDYKLSSAVEVKFAANSLNQVTAKLAKSGVSFNVSLVFAKPLSIQTSYEHTFF